MNAPEEGPALEREALVLFEASLREPEATRDAWIAARAAGRADLLARIRAFADGDRLAALATGAALRDVEPEEPLPERIGAYRIVGRIGHGGMGSVYRGERAMGDFDHVVAIKVIKPGLLGETLIDRFRREREILARLRHPGIAQLYDGGATEGGAPFIVMEYVEGRPLLEWAKEANPARTDRLRVFAQMCDAVAFAHRNLIVHRDLTPSNVLVTADGVKLIDFGIAKPADILAEAGLTTARASVASLSLTPGYAAPERSTGTTVTTAADVYSLGRLLEKLVPPERDRELRAIVARATAEAPGGRYATADALADDVARLGDGRPVAAIGGGARYRTAKFVSRYRTAVGAGVLAVLALVAGLGFSLHAYARAETARAAEASRFAQVRRLAGYLLFDLNDRLERTVGNTAARADLAKQAQGYLTSLAGSRDAEPRIRYEAAVGLIKLARIQGVPNEPNLGDGKQAGANLRTAERLLAGLRDTPGITAAFPLAEARALQSIVAIQGGDDGAKAAALLASAKRALAAAPRDADIGPWVRAQRTVRQAELDNADMGERPADLLRLANALEADIARWPAASRASYQARLDRAFAAYYRALAKSMGDDAKVSVSLFLEAERRFTALRRERRNDPLLLYMSAYNAMIGFSAASRAGQEDVSARLITAAAADIEQVARLEENDDAIYTLTVNIKEGLSQNLRDRDRFAEAIALQRQVIAQRRRDLRGRPSGTLGLSLSILGVIARDAKDRELACRSWREAETTLVALESRKELNGFFASYLPGLRANLRKCAAGAPVSAFGPIRG